MTPDDTTPPPDPRPSPCTQCGKPGHWSSDDEWFHENFDAALDCRREGTSADAPAGPAPGANPADDTVIIDACHGWVLIDAANAVGHRILVLTPKQWQTLPAIPAEAINFDDPESIESTEREHILMRLGELEARLDALEDLHPDRLLPHPWSHAQPEIRGQEKL